MKKDEFLASLRTSLNGKVPSAVVNDTMNYYEEYFATSIREGKDEEAIAQDLGDPRLLAKSIVDQSERKSSASVFEEGYAGASEDEEFNFKNAIKAIISKTPTWVYVILAIALVYILISVVFTIAKRFFPVIVIALLAFGVYYFVFKKKDR